MALSFMVTSTDAAYDWTVSIPVEMDYPWPIEVLEDWKWTPKFARIGEGIAR